VNIQSNKLTLPKVSPNRNMNASTGSGDGDDEYEEDFEKEI
jgi:hypothetical protein